MTSLVSLHAEANCDVSAQAERLKSKLLTELDPNSFQAGWTDSSSTRRGSELFSVWEKVAVW